MLTIGRVEILAESEAGGHRIGAPATADEVRELAREFLRLKVENAVLSNAIGRIEGATDEHRKAVKIIADSAFATRTSRETTEGSNG